MLSLTTKHYVCAKGDGKEAEAWRTAVHGIAKSLT